MKKKNRFWIKVKSFFIGTKQGLVVVALLSLLCEDTDSHDLNSHLDKVDKWPNEQVVDQTWFENLTSFKNIFKLNLIINWSQTSSNGAEHKPILSRLNFFTLHKLNESSSNLFELGLKINKL